MSEEHIFHDKRILQRLDLEPFLSRGIEDITDKPLNLEKFLADLANERQISYDSIFIDGLTICQFEYGGNVNFAGSTVDGVKIEAHSAGGLAIEDSQIEKGFHLRFCPYDDNKQKTIEVITDSYFYNEKNALEINMNSQKNGSARLIVKPQTKIYQIKGVTFEEGRLLLDKHLWHDMADMFGLNLTEIESEYDGKTPWYKAKHKSSGKEIIFGSRKRVWAVRNLEDNENGGTHIYKGQRTNLINTIQAYLDIQVPVAVQ
jgi:hypothetical protein